MAPKREAEEPTCYGPNYEKVPCTPASDLADAAPAGPALAMPAADTPDTLDLVRRHARVWGAHGQQQLSGRLRWPSQCTPLAPTISCRMLCFRGPGCGRH
eukprot:scaffold1700_cov106-Isochrysis_galbana.AAC.4